MNTIENNDFLNIFVELFGDFEYNKETIITDNTDNTDNVKNYIDLIKKANREFEKESLNISTIYIGNVDNFIEQYKMNIFRTKKSMKLVKKKVKSMKCLKIILQKEFKIISNEFFNKKESQKKFKKY